MLFVLLFFLAACLAITVLLAGVLGWTRWATSGKWSGRFGVWGAAMGIGLSILSWAVAVVLVTPAGIIANVTDLNPVMIGMLLGYTLPVIAGGYLLQNRRTTPSRSVVE
ncbi:hypothetical protein JCM17823_24020 [Halorubrum gandharaense]